MPGPHEVVREHLGEIEAEEAVQLGSVVLRGGADECLEQEERGHHEEEPRARPLRRCQRDLTRRAERQRGLLAAVPAQEVPAAEHAEQEADPAEQQDQREHRPHHDIGRRLVVDARLGRPVVRIGVVLARALGRSRPRRPGEECGQLPQLRAVGDRLGPQAAPGRRVREEARVVADELPERVSLRRAERERAAPLVVAVGPEVLDRPAGGRVRPRAAVAALDEVRRAAQVIGGEVGAQVRAVAEHGAVLHEPVVQEDLLALADVRAGVEHRALRVDDTLGHRRLGHVGAIGEQPEDEEAEEDDQRDGLDPALGHEQCPPLAAHACRPLDRRDPPCDAYQKSAVGSRLRRRNPRTRAPAPGRGPGGRWTRTRRPWAGAPG